MIITAAQCRAARALLDWSQPDLAKQSGVHVQTISNFEHGNGSPTSKTLGTIKQIFESAGVEFLDHDGVSRKSSEIESYKGRTGFLNFIMDVYIAMKAGGDICVSNVNEDDFLKWEGDEADAHMARMASISGLRCRFLIQEGDTNIVASHYADYRMTPKENFGDIPFYIYGDKTALISFQADDVEVFMIRHAQITRYFKERFNDIWKTAKPVKVK